MEPYIDSSWANPQAQIHYTQRCYIMPVNFSGNQYCTYSIYYGAQVGFQIHGDMQPSSFWENIIRQISSVHPLTGQSVSPVFYVNWWKELFWNAWSHMWKAISYWILNKKALEDTTVPLINAVKRLVQSIVNGFNKNNQTLACFVDLAKAFDSVWRLVWCINFQKLV